LIDQRHLLANYGSFPLLWALPALVALTLGLTGAAILRERPGHGFVLSSLAIVGHLAMVGASLYPYFVKASDDGRSLTIFNASSTERTLTVMLVVAGIGVPIVLGYTIWVYRQFRGKVPTDGGDGHY
jgi:cytochrome bd ubiquinol oxidase subunit II